jgi:NADP-dependent 3-hydroxy acid dehydrogenase YdfG
VYGATKHAVNVISNTLRQELEDDNIRVVTIMPGAIATNFARNFDPAVVAGIVKSTGVDVEVKQGERLPDEVFERFPEGMRRLFGHVDDVANAVFYAVTQPIDVNVQEIVVRPPKQMAL